MGDLEDQKIMLYDEINHNNNSGLSCFEISDNPWGMVITRKMTTWSHDWIQLTHTLYADQNVLFWNQDQDQSHAIFLYPWDDLDESSGYYRMSPICHGDITTLSCGKKINIHAHDRNLRLHRFLSRIQYPYLAEIRRTQCWIQEFRKRQLLKYELVNAVYHPDRFQSILRFWNY